MGFCLFEDADFTGSFLAVNSTHVKRVEVDAGNEKISLLSFTAPVFMEGREMAIRVIGTVDDVVALLNQAAKIGLNKARLHLMNKLTARPIPLLLNEPDRIMLVRELQPEEFMDMDGSLITASRLYFLDGKHRFISERPGVFVGMSNARGQTPLLRGNPKD